MRVAFVAPETVHHRETPATERIDRVVRMLDDRGHDVVVLCARWWDAGDVDEFEKEGIRYRAIADRVDAGRKLAVTLPLALRRESPEVVHADGRAARAVRIAAHGAKLVRSPVVAEWYDTDPTTGKGPKAVSSAERLIAPSRLVRTRLREAGADADDVTVIPDPVDADLIRSVDPDRAYEDEIVYARRLDEGANLESLLLALAELREFDWSTTVVGDGPAREEYEQQARDLRIDDRVTFVGEADRERRIGIYRAARAFVQTARQCVFPTELAWAMACGCVGIVEYHVESSAHELVEGRDRGFRTTTETEMVEAIREAGEYEHLDYDGEFEEYDEDPVRNRYLECYREVMDDVGYL